MNEDKSLAKSIPTKEVCERLGLDIYRDRNIICPFHPDRNPSCHIYPDHFHCFACGATGDNIALAMKVLFLDFTDATEWLLKGQISHDMRMSCTDIPNRQIVDSKPNKVATFSHTYEKLLSLLPNCESNHYLVGKRKLSEAVLKENSIKSIPKDTREIVQGLKKAFDESTLFESGLFSISKKSGKPYFFFFSCCAVVPFFRGDKIIYFQGINGEEARAKGGKKTLNLKGGSIPAMWAPKNLPKSGSDLYIVEGIITALTAPSLGISSAAVTSSKANPEEVCNILEPYKERKILLIPDIDNVGVEGFRNLAITLKERGFNVDPKLKSVRNFARYWGANEADLLKIKDLNDLRLITYMGD